MRAYSRPPAREITRGDFASVAPLGRGIKSCGCELVCDGVAATESIDLAIVLEFGRL